MTYDVFESDRSKATVLPNGLKYLVKEIQGKKPQLMIWQPKAKKPFYNYLVNADQVARIIQEYSDRLDYHKQMKAEYKAHNAVTPEKLEQVKPGDIFYCSWGWEQTNIDFYKVIERKGKKVTVCSMSCEVVSTDSWASGKKMPGNTILEEQKTYTLTFYGYEPQFKISSFETASKWDGKPKFYSEWA